jgi:hypothetical protein
LDKRADRHDAFWIAERLGSEFLTPKKAFDETLAGDRQAKIVVVKVDRLTRSLADFAKINRADADAALSAEQGPTA